MPPNVPGVITGLQQPNLFRELTRVYADPGMQWEALKLLRILSSFRTLPDPPPQGTPTIPPGPLFRHQSLLQKRRLSEVGKILGHVNTSKDRKHLDDDWFGTPSWLRWKTPQANPVKWEDDVIDALCRALENALGVDPASGTPTSWPSGSCPPLMSVSGNQSDLPRQLRTLDRSPRGIRADHLQQTRPIDFWWIDDDSFTKCGVSVLDGVDRVAVLFLTPAMEPVTAAPVQ